MSNKGRTGISDELLDTWVRSTGKENVAQEIVRISIPTNATAEDAKLMYEETLARLNKRHPDN